MTENDKKELLKRLETLINSDDVYAEIAEKLLNKVALKKERKYKYSCAYCAEGINIHNMFSNDKKNEEDYLRWFKIDEKVRDIAYELGVPSEEDWNNLIDKYAIGYNHKSNQLYTRSDVYFRIPSTIYSIEASFPNVVKSRIAENDLIFWCTYTKP